LPPVLKKSYKFIKPIQIIINLAKHFKITNQTTENNDKQLKKEK